MSDRIHVIEASRGGDRIDRFLADQGAPFVSRSFVQNLIAAERVFVNGRMCTRASYKIAAGDRIEVHVPPPPPPVPEPESLPLKIVYEDEAVLVIDKPRGMVVHPAPGHTGGTLVNAILAHCDLAGVGSKERPGIVHRLDKGTSGLLVVAKLPEAYVDLVRQLRDRCVERRYIAFVHGLPRHERWTVDAPIARHPIHRQRMAVVPGGKEAVTHFACLHRFAGAACIAAKLVTGRTHQIRVHSAYVGHPLIGDTRYGGAFEPLLGEDGQALHAANLSFRHPLTGQHLCFESPLPADLQALREKLERTEV